MAPKLTPDDIIIPVMGVTGVGKSTFIANATGQSVEIGHGLDSCTTDLKIFSGQVHGRTVYFVDTPGFDDKDVNDADILKMIANYLHEMSKEQLRITSILYLHKITDNRFTGSSKRLLRVFQEVCGHESFRSVVLGTTMWDECNESAGQKREIELKGKDYWGQMLQNGTDCHRLRNSTESAIAIVEVLVGKPKTILQMQQQLNRNNGNAAQTSAGKLLDRFYDERIKSLEKELKRVEDKLERAEKETKRKRLEEARLRLQEPTIVIKWNVCTIL